MELDRGADAIVVIMDILGLYDIIDRGNWKLGVFAMYSLCQELKRIPSVFIVTG